MRLLIFKADAYLGPQKWHMNFALNAPDEERTRGSLRFLVGPNGVGKSTLLRFLAAIFRATEDGFERFAADDPAYTVPFYLCYELDRGPALHRIEIRGQGQGRRGITFSINGERREAGEIPPALEVLPFAILIYTAGDLMAWKRLFGMYDEDLLEDDDAPLPGQYITEESVMWETTLASEQYTRPLEQSDRRLLLLEPAHLPLALLAVLLSRSSEFKPVLERVNIRALIHFSLVMSSGPYSGSETDVELLERLFNAASLTLGRHAGDSQAWLYDLDAGGDKAQEVVDLLAPGGNEAFGVFRELERLMSLGILLEVNLVLEKRLPKRATSTLLLEHLSDGEAGYLTRMALLHLVPKETCLFMLDEPEVHFNDAWKRGVIDYLDNSLEGTRSQVILTTHDSLTLSDAYAHEVILLGPDGQGRVKQTLGSEPGEILRHVYDAGAAVGARAERLVNEALASSDPEKIERLLREVGPGWQRVRLLHLVD